MHEKWMKQFEKVYKTLGEPCNGALCEDCPYNDGVRGCGMVSLRSAMRNMPGFAEMEKQTKGKPEPVKLTVAQIAEKLGYDVEVVKE